MSKLNQLKSQLDDLKKKEVIAQTREQLLVEEKRKLLEEIEVLFKSIRELNIVAEEDLTSSNLSNIVNKLQTYTDQELSKNDIPQELK